MKLHKRRLKGCLKKKISGIRVKRILKRNEKFKTWTVRNEFRLNQFITLRLIDYGNTHTCTFIFINDRRFNLYEFSFKEILEIINGKKDYFCMDEARLDLLGTYDSKNFMEDPDSMFWIYCYYIDAWVQCNYDWRLLIVEDAFPMLHALYRAGDPKAREVFKIEIVNAFLSGYLPVVFYLISGKNMDYVDYLDYFKFEEMIWLFEKCLKIVGFHVRSELKTKIYFFLKNKGSDYYYRDNFKKAIKYLNEAIKYRNEALKIYPDDLETLKILGIAYLKNSDYEFARALLIFVLDLSSSKISSSDDIYFKKYCNNINIAEVWYYLGELYNRLFLFNKAIIACNMAMHLDEDRMNTWDQIAVAYEGIGDFERAKEAKNSFKKIEKKIIKNMRKVKW